MTDPKVSDWDEMISFLRRVAAGKEDFWDGTITLRSEDKKFFALALETLNAHSITQLCPICNEPAPHTMMVPTSEEPLDRWCAWCFEEAETELTTQTLAEDPGKGRQV